MKVIGSLIGIDSNAFSLMAHFTKLAKKQGFDSEWIDGVINDAMSNDYENLIRTLDSNMTENK